MSCWQTWRPDAASIPCDTERKRCEICGQHPADIGPSNFGDGIWFVCSACANDGRRNYR